MMSVQNVFVFPFILKSQRWKLIKFCIYIDIKLIRCSFFSSFRVTAHCNSIYCLDNACLSNSTPPIFREHSDILYTYLRDIEYVYVYIRENNLLTK